MTTIDAAPDARTSATRLTLEETLLIAVIVYFIALRVTIAPVRTSFDDWSDPAAHLGETAIFLEQEQAGAEWRASFGEITELERIPAQVWGYTVRTYVLYLAKDFRGRK